MTTLAFPEKLFDHEVLSGFTPEDCIRRMFAQADENGRVNIPAFPSDDPDVEGEDVTRFYYALTLDRRQNDDAVIEAYTKLYADLRVIAPLRKEIGNSVKKAQATLDGELYHTWYIYLRDLPAHKMYHQLYDLAQERDLTSAEQAKVEACEAALRAQCKRRLGGQYCCGTVISRARRLCALFDLGAPDVILHHEAVILAMAMVIHRHAEKMEVVQSAS